MRSNGGTTRDHRPEGNPRRAISDDTDTLKRALQLEARLLAYDVAITRSWRVIPRSLEDFIGHEAQ